MRIHKRTIRILGMIILHISYVLAAREFEKNPIFW